MFVDKATITIKAGNGGDGCVHFYRAKYVLNGGPDGGNGGKGGNIVFVADKGMTNLIDFRFTKVFRAENGLKGEGNNRQGKSGQDLIITVPLGTVIKDFETGKIIADMMKENEPKIILEGGNGGRGNSYFANSRRQTPTFCEQGEAVKEYKVTLELKTIADVGLVGYPSVGKSMLLSIMTNAKPKIASYHFTTLVPNLGISSYKDINFLIADIPGIIDGASQGKGLGLEFLRHIERTRVLVHLIDIAELEGRTAIQDFNAINNELAMYSQKLVNRPQIVVLNKYDLLEDDEPIIRFKKELGDKYPVVVVSCETTQGINELKQIIVETLSKTPLPEATPIEEESLDKKDYTTFEVRKLDENRYEVYGGFIDKLIRSIIVNDPESFAYFQKRLRNHGVIEKLKEIGMKDGDTLVCKDLEFEYFD
ncbi:MAG: GTPase ObgE [Clostridia bacterium]|nr:GTPase ObgE [Clostridia bacterium]